jgi:hypothetical protein
MKAQAIEKPVKRGYGASNSGIGTEKNGYEENANILCDNRVMAIR